VLSDKTGTLTENIMELVGFTYETGSQIVKDLIAKSHAERVRSVDFFRSLAVCSMIIVWRSPEGKTEYNAESPDEAAFVEFAAGCGITLTDRQPELLALDIRRDAYSYGIVSLLPFDSERKRMTIVVQEDGQSELVSFRPTLPFSLANSTYHRPFRNRKFR
jgi:magnesium-transporting ATPase (P-type)